MTRWRKRRRDEDFRQEIEAHLALEGDRLVSEGMDPQQARASARRTFGNTARAAEDFYESRRVLWLDALLRDARYAVRGVYRNPGFAALAILTLAFGIGVNTAVFSVVHAVLLRPLPYKDADRIVRIYEHAPGASADGMRPIGFTKVELDLLRRSSWAFTHAGIYLPSTMTLSGSGEAIRLNGVQISPALIAMLDVRPAIGRIFEPHEDAPMDRVVILSHRGWQRRFSADVNVVGRPVMLDGNPYTVIGVMPRGFYFPDPETEYWVPFVFPSGARLVVTARVRDGIEREAAAREIGDLLNRARSGSLYPAPPPPPPPPPPRADGRPRTLEEVRSMSPPTAAPLQPAQVSPRKPDPLQVRLLGFQDFVIGEHRRALLMLAGAVGFVLLIACANVANLLLARGAARQHEFIVRLAIGASRGRLMRQLLTESTLLAGLGGVLGTILAAGAVEVLRGMGATLPRSAFGPGFGIPRLDEVAIDPSVLTFTGAVAVFAGIVSGVIPAAHSTFRQYDGALRSSTSSSESGWRWSRGARLRPLLVVFELALATVLLVSATLLIRSFVKLTAVHPGYEAAGVLTFQVVAPRTREMDVVAKELREQIGSVPGVESVAFANQLPMSGARGIIALRRTPGAAAGPPPPPAPGGSGLPQFPSMRIVSPNFTTVMRMRILEGRGLRETDVAGSQRVMLINQTLARSGYLGPHPVGTDIFAIGPEPWHIVGIVEDVRQSGLDQASGPEVLIPDSQLPARAAGPSTASPFFVVRTGVMPAAAVPDIRAVIARYDSRLGLDRVATLEDIVSNTLVRPRFFTALLSVFAAFAMFLALTGIYGVLAYMVRQRSREIGIRISLGATRTRILGLVLSEGALLSSAGVMLGLAASVVATRSLSNQLFGVTSFDVPTYLGVALTFGLVAALASYVPARRATRIDAVIALRQE